METETLKSLENPTEHTQRNTETCFFGRISLSRYVLNGDGIFSPFSPIILPSGAKNKPVFWKISYEAGQGLAKIT